MDFGENNICANQALTWTYLPRFWKRTTEKYTGSKREKTAFGRFKTQLIRDRTYLPVQKVEWGKEPTTYLAFRLGTVEDAM